MNTPNDGGPAFPVYIPDERNLETGEGIRQGMAWPGASLRDWFAGMALANNKICEGGNSDRDACYAYQWADAMLAARNKENP